MTNESAATTIPLWSDDPSDLDLLGFIAVAATVVDALLNDKLDPVVVGISGRWGSGKTTVLKLVSHIIEKTDHGDQTILVILTDPWRYDPVTGPKESLITEVLLAVKNEIAKDESALKKLSGLLNRLARRVHWSKAIQIAAKTSLAFQLPSFEELISIVSFDPSGGDAPDADPSLTAFREEFTELLESEELKHVSRVVVLVDDLDRCLPETVVETLEAIKLFLSVPKMSFVIAADEHRVAEALSSRFPDSHERLDEQVDVEPQARLYLHKIVQTMVPLPALSRFDTEAYLILLLLQQSLGTEKLAEVASLCDGLRCKSGSLDDLGDKVTSESSSELALAARLTPILYEKLRGNPRRIKRFLNDLFVRRAIAERRGIKLETDVVAKLMVLEGLLPDAFEQVLSWLATNELRERMKSLHTYATGPTTEIATETEGQEPPEGDTGAESPEREQDSKWDKDLVRWAKMAPPLGDIDLAPYLNLAAAFGARLVLDTMLPDHLRDVASSLASSIRAEQKSVTNADLQALTQQDAEKLVTHLARALRDRPSEQAAVITGLLRIVKIHPEALTTMSNILRATPPEEVQPATVLLMSEIPELREILKDWHGRLPSSPTKRAIEEALGIKE